MVATGLTGALVSTQAAAQAKEQFFPVLVYRTGAYAHPFQGLDHELKYPTATVWNEG